jgi:hypothetical protein
MVALKRPCSVGWNPHIVMHILASDLSSAHHVCVAPLREVHMKDGDMMKIEDYV